MFGGFTAPFTRLIPTVFCFFTLFAGPPSSTTTAHEKTHKNVKTLQIPQILSSPQSTQISSPMDPHLNLSNPLLLPPPLLHQPTRLPHLPPRHRSATCPPTPSRPPNQKAQQKARSRKMARRAFRFDPLRDGSRVVQRPSESGDHQSCEE